MAQLDGRWRLLYSSGFTSGSLGGRRPGPSFASSPLTLGQVWQDISVGEQRGVVEGRTLVSSSAQLQLCRCKPAKPQPLGSTAQLPARLPPSAASFAAAATHGPCSSPCGAPIQTQPLICCMLCPLQTAPSWTTQWSCSCATAWLPCPVSWHSRRRLRSMRPGRWGVAPALLHQRGAVCSCKHTPRLPAHSQCIPLGGSAVSSACRRGGAHAHRCGAPAAHLPDHRCQHSRNNVCGHRSEAGGRPAGLAGPAAAVGGAQAARVAAGERGARAGLLRRGAGLSCTAASLHAFAATERERVQ